MLEDNYAFIEYIIEPFIDRDKNYFVDK